MMKLSSLRRDIFTENHLLSLIDWRVYLHFFLSKSLKGTGGTVPLDQADLPAPLTPTAKAELLGSLSFPLATIAPLPSLGKSWLSFDQHNHTGVTYIPKNTALRPSPRSHGDLVFHILACGLAGLSEWIFRHQESVFSGSSQRNEEC